MSDPFEGLPPSEQGDGVVYKMTAAFMIDGTEFTDRDREMFVLGAEFAMLFDTLIASSGEEFSAKLHSANRERVLYLLARYKRTWTATEDDGGWFELAIEEGPSE